MSKIRLTQTCNITTGKLDANAAEDNGLYPYFTCAPEPLKINTYAFDDDVILLAGNNASGNFHCQRYKGKFNAYQRTYVITAKPGYDLDYIYYNLQINLSNLKKIAQGSQTKFLTMQILDAFEIEDLELSKQQKVSGILSLLDKKIINNTEIEKVLLDLSGKIYSYWFLQYEFPNEEGKPYKSSGGEMEWNTELKREIPCGWKVVDLSQLCDFNNGINYDKDEKGDTEYKIINVRNISSSTLLIDKSDLDSISLNSQKANKYLVEKDDILIARSGIPGAVRLLEDVIQNNIVFCGFIIRCKPYDPILRYYLAFTLKVLEGTSATKTGGSILQNVSQDTLKAVRIIIPPKKVLDAFNHNLATIMCNMKKTIEENQELSSFRDYILPVLINGQVSFKGK